MKLPTIFKRRNALSTKANPVGMYLYQTGVYRGSAWCMENYIKLALNKNPTVKEVVNKISIGASNVPIKLKQKKGEVVTEIIDHPALKLLNKPNPTMTKQELLEYFFTSRLVVGNAFILATQLNESRPPLELWVADARNFAVKPGDTGIPSAYKYQGSTGEVIFPVDEITGMSTVYHSKNVSLNDPNWGESPLESGRVWVDVSNQGAEWNASMLENGARPSGAMSITGTLTDEQFHQMNERMKTTYEGTKNSGKPMLLEGGMEWVEMSKSVKDMDFMSSMNYSDKKICGIYGYPYALMSTEASTYNNMQTAREMLWEDTISPLFDSFLESFGFWLLPKFGLDAAPTNQQGYYFEADYSRIPAYEAKEAAKTDRVIKLVAGGLIAPNEGRKELGYNKYDGEGADEIYIASSMIPIDTESQQVNDALNATNQLFVNPPQDNPDDPSNSGAKKKAARSRKRTKGS